MKARASNFARGWQINPNIDVQAGNQHQSQVYMLLDAWRGAMGVEADGYCSHMPSCRESQISDDANPEENGPQHSKERGRRVRLEPPRQEQQPTW